MKRAQTQAGAWSELTSERLLAGLSFAFAVVYTLAARRIEDSLLSDEVGAGGVPQAVGMAMALAALALFAKSFRRPPAKAEAAAVEANAPVAAMAPTIMPATTPAAEQADGNTRGWQAALLRTTGLVLILLAYAALLPLLGYPVTISLLIVAVGWLAGAPLRTPLCACALLGGPLLWLLFDQLLQVRMPRGLFGF